MKTFKVAIMNISDLNKPITADSLNKRLAKVFGEKLDLSKFKTRDLKESKKKINQKLQKIEVTESFGKLNKNEKYQKNKLVSEILEKAIKERESSGSKGTQGSKNRSKGYSDHQQKAAQEAEDYQNGKLNYGDLSSSAKRLANKDHNELEKMKRNEIEEKVKRKRVKEKAESEDQRKAAAIALKHKREGTKPKKGTASAEMMSMSKKELEKYASKSESQNKKGKSLKEGEEDKAELIMATKNMVDKITGWMQDTSELKSESLIEIVDTMRDELGQNEAEEFSQTMEPALDSLYSSMEEARDTLIGGVNKLTGEEGETMGDDPDADMDDDTMGGEDDLEGDNEEDGLEDELEDLEGEEPEDEFAGADTATGGEEETGRPKRESIQRSKRLASVLSSSPKKK